MSRSISVILDKSNLLCSTILTTKCQYFITAKQLCQYVCSFWLYKKLFYFSVSVRCNEGESIFLKIPSLPRGADTLEIEIVTVRAH